MPCFTNARSILSRHFSRIFRLEYRNFSWSHQINRYLSIPRYLRKLSRVFSCNIVIINAFLHGSAWHFLTMDYRLVWHTVSFIELQLQWLLHCICLLVYPWTYVYIWWLMLISIEVSDMSTHPSIRWRWAYGIVSVPLYYYRLSSYPSAAFAWLCSALHVPLLLQQNTYNLFYKWIAVLLLNATTTHHIIFYAIFIIIIVVITVIIIVYVCAIYPLQAKCNVYLCFYCLS